MRTNEFNYSRARLFAEMLLLYVVGPLILYILVYRYHIPLLLMLPFVLVGLVAILLGQQSQDWRQDLRRLPRKSDIIAIFVLFGLAGGALTLYAFEAFPETFLGLPRYHTALWLLIMIFYPLISVTTQEMIYRLLYFDRYAPAIGSHPWLKIFVNATFFAGMHAVLFGAGSHAFHWEAVVISITGGLLFAYRFVRTKSLMTVALEHALYGDLIFTIGLGRFFFTGVAHL